jgi:hypothetical protein
MTVAACLGIYLSFVVILEEWYQYGDAGQEGKKKNAGVRLLRRCVCVYVCAYVDVYLSLDSSELFFQRTHTHAHTANPT